MAGKLIHGTLLPCFNSVGPVDDQSHLQCQCDTSLLASIGVQNVWAAPPEADGRINISWRRESTIFSFGITKILNTQTRRKRETKCPCIVVTIIGCQGGFLGDALGVVDVLGGCVRRNDPADCSKGSLGSHLGKVPKQKSQKR
jgi:hypothetical protein